jgi:hypothetical protein
MTDRLQVFRDESLGGKAVGDAWVDLSTVDSDNERGIYYHHYLQIVASRLYYNWDSLCLNSRRVPVEGKVVPTAD